jgi:hypothetical protein
MMMWKHAMMVTEWPVACWISPTVVWRHTGEEEKEFDHHNTHVAARKKAEKEGKQNLELEIIADEDGVCHKEAQKRAWNAQLKLSTSNGEKDWNILNRNFKKNGKCPTLLWVVKKTLHCMKKNCKKESRTCKGSSKEI